MQVQLPQALPQFLKARMGPPRGGDVEPIRTTAFGHGTTDFGGDGLGLRGGHHERGAAAGVRALLLRRRRQEGGGGEGMGDKREEKEENAEEEGWSRWEW